MMRRTLCLPALLLVGACASGYPEDAAVATAAVDRIADPAMMQGAIEDAVAASPPMTGAALTGIASWYGPRHHGRPTANGERYDMRAFTAAHPSLPMGTRLRVIDTATGRSVAVMVNDRGPHVAGRILDLSWRAAHELGMLRTGVAAVALQILPPAESRLSVMPSSRRTGVKPVYPAADAPADGQRPLPPTPFLDAQLADRSTMAEKQIPSTRLRP